MRSRALRNAVLWLAAALAGSPLAAQQACGRCLNGHRFLPSSVVGTPFADTYFTNSTGAGLALDLTIPVRNVEGEEVGTIGGDIGFLLLDFEYQKAVARWLALRGKFGVVARLGTSTEAIVASGASAVYGGSLGATVPLWRASNFFVSFVADVRRNTQYIVDPFTFAQRIADSGYTEEAKELLLRDEASTHWSAGLRGAWAVQSWVGLNLQIESGEIDTPLVGMESLSQIGAQVGFDFTRIWRVPLGLSLGYRENAGNGRTGEFSGSYRITELGLFYTGHPAFSIGGDLFWSRIAVNAVDVPDLDAVQFRLVTRIDF
ncbi:MAG TPA: hypothetical protein VLE53_20015 [Gemmatimonadaceae bacterium]|nr:hypothetical protein [Gemmatimonadaceae bacterium]